MQSSSPSPSSRVHHSHDLPPVLHLPLAVGDCLPPLISKSSSTTALVRAVPTNITIDDQYGDPVTGLTPVWSESAYALWNPGSSCPSCYVRPDPLLCYDNTWHDTTVLSEVPSSEYPNFNLTFSGIAIYLFAVIPNTVELNGTYAITAANVTFFLNGTYVANFTHWPDTSTVYEYHAPIYTNESLPLGQHSLQVKLTPGTSGSYLAFDYAVYTIDDGTSVSSSGSPIFTSPAPTTGAIVGGVVGGVAGVIALGLLVFYLRRRRRSVTRLNQFGLGSTTDPSDNTKIEPFRAEPGGTHYHPYAQSSFASLEHNRRLTTPSRVFQAMDESSGLRNGSAPGLVSLQSPTGLPLPVVGHSRKAAERHRELAQQVHEMEQRAAILNARRAETSLLTTRAEGDRELRTQVETLIVEMGRLKAEQEEQRLLMTPTEQPPAYEHSPFHVSDHDAMQHSPGDVGIAV